MEASVLPLFTLLGEEMTPDLFARVKVALETPCERPWLPELTEELAQRQWRTLYREIGLSPSTYGTARMMTRSPNGPRRIVARLPRGLYEREPCCALQVEILDKQFTLSYEEAGVRFCTPAEIRGSNLLGQLEEAATLLKFVEPLHTVMGQLVRSVHLLDAGDDEYDVSFSEPHIPFTIFVSAPRCRAPNGALRLAESLVHEVMHLQLSLIEQVVTIIKPNDGRYFSPWRAEYRNANGILHALYVFRMIDCFFEALLKTEICSDHSEYARRRRSEINVQIDEVRGFSNSRELTNIGQAFVSSLIR